MPDWKPITIWVNTLKRAVHLASSATSVHSDTSTKHQILTLCPIFFWVLSEDGVRFLKNKMPAINHYRSTWGTHCGSISQLHPFNKWVIYSVNKFFFKFHLFVRYYARSLRSEGESRHLDTVHSLIKRTKCHEKTLKKGNNLDWRSRKASWKSWPMNWDLTTGEEDFKRQKSRKHVFKNRKKEVCSRQSKQEEQRDRSLQQYGKFLEGGA